jgi:hypothetical protein
MSGCVDETWQLSANLCKFTAARTGPAHTCHFDTRSDDDTAMNVESPASLAIAWAMYLIVELVVIVCVCVCVRACVCVCVSVW